MRVAGKRQAVGLYRVSTAEQEQIGLGFEAQQAFVASQAGRWYRSIPTSRAARDVHPPINGG
jgi:hypothetical protein